MIRVEKGTCDIKTSEGVPGLMADLAVIVRTLKKTLTEKCDQSEAEAKEVINRAVELGLVTDAELESEAFKVVWFDEQGEPYKVVAWMPLPEVFRG